MEAMKNPGINFPVMSVLGALTITVMLLILIPTLTEINIIPKQPADRPSPIVIDTNRPPEPVEPVNEARTLTQITPIKTETAKDRPQPVEPVKQNPVMMADAPVGVPITTSGPITDIEAPEIADIFSVFQVDRAPFITRLVKPMYPFSAKSSGIEGRVVLRFVVDEKGFVQDPEVVQSEPEGVFERPALEAIVKYRFKPALIGNRPVKCIVKLPMAFTLSE